MTPLVLVLIAGAAVLHTLWNVLLKASEDPLATSARAVGWGLVLATPLVGAAWWLAGLPIPPLQAWIIAGVSAVVELLYFVFLSAAYRRGELSLVYPVARGTAPVLAVAIGVVVLGERLDAPAAFGVVLLLAGIWLVRSPTGSGPAFGFAVLTGVAIAFYSALDRLGVQVAPPVFYAWILWLFTALLLRAWLIGRAALVGVESSAGPPAAPNGRTGRDVLVGAAMLGAWFLVLVALSLAPLAVVAPLRESAVVLATGWGVLRLRERGGAPLRFAGALAIVGGVALLALT